MSFLSKLKTPIYKNTGSIARDHLASERTFLAWARTGLGFIALGIAIERFNQLDVETVVPDHHSSPQSPHKPPPNTSWVNVANPTLRTSTGSNDKQQVLVAALLGMGSGSVVYGFSRYWSNMKLLEQGMFKPAYLGAASLGLAVASLAGAMIWTQIKDVAG